MGSRFSTNEGCYYYRRCGGFYVSIPMTLVSLRGECPQNKSRFVLLYFSLLRNIVLTLIHSACLFCLGFIMFLILYFGKKEENALFLYHDKYYLSYWVLYNEVKIISNRKIISHNHSTLCTWHLSSNPPLFLLLSRKNCLYSWI